MHRMHVGDVSQARRQGQHEEQARPGCWWSSRVALTGPLQQLARWSVSLACRVSIAIRIDGKFMQRL
jgi:hypothetical protein